jgi:hypothetical protein
MRLAGDPNLAPQLARLLGDGSAEAAASSAKADSFWQLYALLQSKGYSPQAAQQVALEMVDGRQPMAQMTRRFAAIYGDPSTDPEPSRGAD